MRAVKVLLLFFLVFGINLSLTAGDAGEKSSEAFNPGEVILHHIGDSYSWHLFSAGNFHAEIPLPVILYSPEAGLDIFLSGKFHHGAESYKGYRLDHGHIVREDGKAFYDFSVTKNAAAVIFNALLLMFVFIGMAKSYAKNKKRAPKGLQSLFEPIIVFIRDEIARPTIGPKYERFLPFLLTLFFFIWFGNMLGLMPGAANMTGNIAVTMLMALCTLALTLFNGNKQYWNHIFNPPGVPVALLPIIIPVEIIGIFTKPFSLMVRLFVAMTAGHIVILSLISLAFIFQSYVVGVAGGLVVLFINVIELLVAAIQAYVFTLFSSLYIGMAVSEEHH